MTAMRLPAFDQLRAAAALMVVWHHIGNVLLTNSGLRLPFIHAGAAGVDIFFVMSGALMWLTTRDATLSPAQFLWRRLARIVPLYWAVTLTLLAISAAWPAMLNSVSYTPVHAAWSLLFIAAPNADHAGATVPYFLQGWTLNLEMAFYAVFASALWLRRAMAFALVGGGLIALAVIGLLAADRLPPALAFYATPLMLEFAAGMVLARAYGARRALPARVAMALLSAGCAGLVLAEMAGADFSPLAPQPWRVLIWGVPALAIVAGAMCLPQPKPGPGARLFSALGAASYSLYLTHLFALTALLLAWQRLGWGLAGAAGLGFVAVALLIACAAALLCHHAFDRPVSAVLRRLPNRLLRATGRNLSSQAGGEMPS